MPSGVEHRPVTPLQIENELVLPTPWIFCKRNVSFCKNLKNMVQFGFNIEKKWGLGICLESILKNNIVQCEWKQQDLGHGMPKIVIGQRSWFRLRFSQSQTRSKIRQTSQSERVFRGWVIIWTNLAKPFPAPQIFMTQFSPPYFLFRYHSLYQVINLEHEHRKCPDVCLFVICSVEKTLRGSPPNRLWNLQ